MISIFRHHKSVQIPGLLLAITAGLMSVGLLPASGADGSQGSQIPTEAKSSRSKTGALDPQEKARILSEYGRTPLQFEANVGQADPQVQFLARGNRYDIYLLTDKVVFAFPELMPGRIPVNPTDLQVPTNRGKASPQYSNTYVSMTLSGSQRTQVVGKEPLSGSANYLIGNDPQKWHKGVPVFGRAEYPELAPGVDLDLHGIRQQSEFDLIVHPGVDISGLRLGFSGVRHLSLDKSGNLSISSGSGELRLLKPVAYQEVGGERIPVVAEFVRKRHNEIAFRIGSYDKSQELVIDPSVVYSSYLGGSSQDEALGVALDSQGAAYITGTTTSTDFPLRFSLQPFTGTVDAFVTKFHPDGGSLDFSTYFGGSFTTFGTAISVLDQPNAPQPGVYFVGYTDSPDLPLPGYTQQGYAGGLDAYVCLLDLGGLGVLGGSYIGGTQDDVATGVSVDLQGYAWVVGWTKSSASEKFPLINPLQGTFGGATDAFVTQVAQSALFAYSSYLGGSNRDFASAVAIDNPYSESEQYNVYVSGGTSSPDFPTTPFALQKHCGTDGQCNGGKDDAFATAIAFSPGNYSYKYSTFLGGENQDDAYGVAADQNGDAYLTGQTASTQFPITSGAYQNSIRGPQNAFVTEINPGGTSLAYSTYLGGSAKDAGLGIAVDGSYNIYVTGRTLSPDFPTLNATQSAIGGRQDAFVSAFVPVNNAPTLAFSTFLGGSGDEDLVGGGIAVDDSQNVYTVGDTNSSDFPLSGAFQTQFAGSGTCTINDMQAPCEDAFITKILALENPTLTVNLTGTGIAVVTSNPPAIDCSNIPNTCQAKFNFGTQVTLTEQATNTTFNGWSGGGCSGAGDCVLTLTSDQTVSADFTLNVTNVTLTVSIAGTGHGEVVSSPAGIDCLNTSHGTQGVCAMNFPQGTVITLTATPNSDSTFAGWPGNINCLGTAPCIFTLNTATTVQAEFDIDEGTLKVQVDGPVSSGNVYSPPPNGISCPAGQTCSQDFSLGTTVTLTAQASSGYIFAGWNGSGCSGTGTCPVTINAVQTYDVTAVFANPSEPPKLNVTLSGAGSGTVTSSPPGINCPTQACTASFDMNTTVTLTATPNSSSTFNSWSGAAAPCGTNATCSVTITGSFVAVVANFDQIYVPPPSPFSLTASPPGGATIPSGGSTAYGLTLVSFNGYTDTMNLTCSVQPSSSSSPTCTLTPPSVTLGADQAASSTLTINAGGLIARNTNPKGARPAPYELAAAMLMFCSIGGVWLMPTGNLRTVYRNAFRIALLIILAALAVQVGCGGSGKSSGSVSSGSNAQPGNYIVTITATGSVTQVSQSITIPVTVQ